MALINCPECRTQVSDKADKCPHCAYPLKKQVAVESEGCFLQTMNFGCSLVAALIGLFILIIILVAIFSWP